MATSKRTQNQSARKSKISPSPAPVAPEDTTTTVTVWRWRDAAEALERAAKIARMLADHLAASKCDWTGEAALAHHILPDLTHAALDAVKDAAGPSSVGALVTEAAEVLGKSWEPSKKTARG